ncbi:hypothetical protein PISMIDRAFT_383572 [Pisolithus microcarpus 441]|uniref:MYND-type domain-containing protein n=1 Tax=Pisolithus microcarpus 441 TaxID=765257 RepID=A0A0C9ZVP1_9AGAM|nr:hypothetical protein PISMIDRAFT_383572 [Pisolithus microcarpus 441]
MSTPLEKENHSATTPLAPSDLNNPLTFPTFWGLPPEYESNDIDLYSTKPRKHWCFLGKIVSSSVLVRLALEVEDKEGHRLLVAFHTDDRGAAFLDQCKEGHTIAVLYATQHTFAFSPPGLRLEQDAHVKVFPYSLDDMLEASRELFEKGMGKRCEGCDKTETPLRKCSACNGAWYCSRTGCWPAHKRRCPVLKEIQWFTRKNWENSVHQYFFPRHLGGWHAHQHSRNALPSMLQACGF